MIRRLQSGTIQHYSTVQWLMLICQTLTLSKTQKVLTNGMRGGERKILLYSFQLRLPLLSLCQQLHRDELLMIWRGIWTSVLFDQMRRPPLACELVNLDLLSTKADQGTCPCNDIKRQAKGENTAQRDREPSNCWLERIGWTPALFTRFYVYIERLIR